MSQNQLATETSPYLLLHKDNPVHWRVWGPEALAEAEETGKPILLSIGYTACHWCHVMNHESFANSAIADLINDKYIPVKVDREERPDIDQVYQASANAMGHSGGWPLTAFLTARGEPFFVGTYFPNEERNGQPSFSRVLNDVATLYKDQPEPVAQATGNVQDQLAKLWARDLSGQISPQTIDACALHIGRRFDIFNGGLTGSPKFPVTALVETQWRAYLRSGVNQFAHIVQASVDAMSNGGIYDHLGGGYARYSTDERWFVPHFEKMLYDNALIIDLLTLLWQHNRAPLFQQRIEETITWLFRDMMVDQAFASSIDADSDGEEGKYYLWTEAEIDAALMGTFVQRFKDVYGVTKQGNFDNKNILHRINPGMAFPLSEADEALLAKQRSLLLAARDNRNPPLRDNKVMTDWNGLMIAALANAGAAFKKTAWTSAAIKAFDFITNVLGDNDRLYHSWCDGKRQSIAFSEDYANMARAALALWESTSDQRYLDRARAWTRTLNEHYWDSHMGGYFHTADDADPLFVRPRMIFDQAMPSPNATMVTVLAKLFLITGETAYRDQCNALITAFAAEVERATLSVGTFLNAIDTVFAGLQIVIVGPVANPKTHELVAAVMGRSLPQKTLMMVEPDQTLPEAHPAHGKTMENGQPTAYLCQHETCSAPITNPVTLSQMLQLPPKAPSGQPAN